MLSQHARTRSQQRAIPQLAIDLLLQFGTSERAPGGVSKAFFDKVSRRRLAAYAGPLATLLDDHLDLYAVLGEDETVITVGHRQERIKRH